LSDEIPPAVILGVETYKYIEQVHIGEAARRLGVHPHHLRILEWQGRIPTPRRDLNGRIYTEFDIALLKSMGVGSRPRRLKQASEVLEDTQ
jgi:DNA-binding transcriptional MerR regulator